MLQSINQSINQSIRSTKHADVTGGGIRPANYGDGNDRIRSTNHADGTGDGIRHTCGWDW